MNEEIGGHLPVHFYIREDVLLFRCLPNLCNDAV